MGLASDLACTLAEVAGILLEPIARFLSWLNGWSRTPGLAGLAAVIAAVIAYRAAGRGARATEAQATEDRWWEQAKWAAEKLVGSDPAVGVGLAAADHLLQNAPDTQASGFIQAITEAFVLDEASEDVDDGPPDLHNGNN